MKKLFALLPLMALYTALSAQKDPGLSSEMNVDMPDETEEAALVDKGSLQVETALLYNRYHSNDPSLLGQLLVRFGLSERVELRMILEDGKNRDTYFEETVQSTMPVGIGSKISLLKDHQWMPDLTLVTYLSLPVTSKSSAQRVHWSPMLLLAFENKLSDKWKLEYNAGGQQEIFSSQWVWLANGSLHYQIIDPLECFVEYYAQYGVGKKGHNNIGGGLTYQLNSHTQVYLSGGSSIAYGEPNQFVAGGIAFRLP